jgi:hypothetical protein
MSMNWVAILAAMTPLVTELIGLAADIAKTGASPTATVARLRKLLPDVLLAAQAGSTVDTDEEWTEHLRKHWPA